MVTNNVQNIIKMAVNHKKVNRLSFMSDPNKSSGLSDSSKISDNSAPCPSRTAKKNRNILSNINSNMFAMLLQRTTFTVLIIVLWNCSVSVAELMNPSSDPTLVETMSTKVFSMGPEDVTVRSSPIYIPLTESGPTERSFVSNIVNEINSKHSNRTYTTGNTLWDGFLNECSPNPSLSCIQKNVYTYLDESLRFDGDVNVTEGLRFKKNKVAHWKYTEKANEKSSVMDNEVDSDETEQARFSESPIEEVTDALYDKGVGFMMTHDVELKLPDMLFDGAVLKISPRSLEGSGALVHLDLQPRTEVNENGQGRIFFKKIKKYIKNKLLLGLLAIVLVIKLIKLKLFFFLPLILGVHNAKKLFLKLVLFVFPALSHIFKLCSWYHDNYHQTKYHHHHHQISHLHHSAPPHSGYPPAHSVEFHGGYPPSSNSFQHEQPPWELSGPGLGPEFLSGDIHRNAVEFSPKPEDANMINAWGLGPPGPGTVQANQANQAFTKPYSSYYDEQRHVRAAATSEAPIRTKPITPQGPPFGGLMTQKQVNAQIEKEVLLRAAQRQEQLRQVQIQQQQAQEILRQQAEQKIALQQQIVQSQIHKNEITAPVFDPFYTPILGKVDQVFAGLSFNDEPCRERLICSMYKNPLKFSPHSNLISNELSRDASELQKPTPGSPAAIRFYRYVQAARDGQDKKDCLALYSQCPINTELRKK